MFENNNHSQYHAGMDLTPFLPVIVQTRYITAAWSGDHAANHFLHLLIADLHIFAGTIGLFTGVGSVTGFKTR